MGTVKEAGATTTETGLFGYHKGQRSIFLNAEDEQEKTGMKIDLSTPSIEYGNGNFSIDKNGYVYMKGAIIEGYATEGDAQNLIDVSVSGLSSQIKNKIDKTEVISTINQSAEEVSINASRIALEGYTTINKGFSIDEEGNAIMNSATITSGEIFNENGKKILGEEGIYTSLSFLGIQFNTFINSEYITSKYGLMRLGFDSSYYLVGGYTKNNVMLHAYIPDNFTIIDARIILNIYSIHTIYGTQDYGYGYPRKINLYKIPSQNSFDIL
jgi:hypothetical protein